MIRVGDHVRILRPRFVKRVGYPLIAADLEDEIGADPKFNEAAKILDILGDRARLELLRGVCRAQVIMRGFGGRQRTIYYEPPSEFDPKPGDVSEVYATRIVKTGTYIPGYAGQTMHWGEYDSAPAYLDNVKTHKLIQTIDGWIEDCDVEKVS